MKSVKWIGGPDVFGDDSVNCVRFHPIQEHVFYAACRNQLFGFDLRKEGQVLVKEASAILEVES
jgi:hypothetical protein